MEARRLNNLREGLVIERNAEKSDYKWHRYNYYWRSYGSKVNPDKAPGADHPAADLRMTRRRKPTGTVGH
ncbi:hypothetical protein M8494_08855 [Serratia ureilytica]